MKALISIFRIRFLLLIQYRIAALAGLSTQFFFGMIMIMSFQAFFKSGQGMMPMTLSQTITYIWLGQTLLGLLPWNGDREIQKMIRTGDLAYELLRPVSLYQLWFSRVLAQRLAPTLLRCVPLLLITRFLLPETIRIGLPASVDSALYFGLCLFGGILLGCAISNLITIATLFTIGDGVDRLLPAIVILGSGMVIPIVYFPDWSQMLFKWLPFSGLVDAPYRYYLGLYTIDDLPFSLFHIGIWLILLVAIGQWMLATARHRIIIQGG